MNLRSNIVGQLAGSGSEGMEDGDALSAQLAQPTGLALDPLGRILYFADSESSSIRRLSLGEQPHVETLVGAGLFEFGCVNGDLGSARLQHCQGIAYCDGGLLVADTYNNMIRHIDLANCSVSTVDNRKSDTVRPNGHSSCQLAGGEPVGVAADGPDRFLVADTNNHRIVEMRPSRQVSSPWPRSLDQQDGTV
ncbi:MAG: hypothetical protein HC834_06025 [Rhodospirillales bacterium]|nr:hypothetical protein [Rhodospirillales bacterium]